MSTSDGVPDEPATSEDDGQPGTGAPNSSDSVTTGILAAEHRAQTQISRRRRLLIGSAVLGLVIAGAVLVVMAVLQQRANVEAQEAAARAEARAAFAEAVVERAEDYKPPSTAVQRDAAALRDSLEQFLTETETSDDVLATQVEDATTRLQGTADTVAELTGREIAEPDELVAPDRALAVLRELEALRGEARALAAEVPRAISETERWLAYVRDINAAVADHVEQVESEEATSDPTALVELWRDERPALLRLSVAAEAADHVEGLAAWAGAHEQYAKDMLTWIDEAVELLEAGDIDTYNERYDEVFADDDPFGFNAAVADTTADALQSPALLQLGTLDQRAELVLEAVRTTETTVAEQLGSDPT